MAAAVQATGSMQFIDRKWHVPSSSGATIAHSAARVCAKRRPPRVRASSPVSSTVAAPQRAGSTRRARTESPNSAVGSHAIRATSGG